MTTAKPRTQPPITVEAWIERCVAEAPPLTADQRDRIARLLRPALRTPASSQETTAR